MLFFMLLFCVTGSLSDKCSNKCLKGTCAPGNRCELRPDQNCKGNDCSSTPYCSDPCATVRCGYGPCTSQTESCDGTTCNATASCPPNPCAFTLCQVNSTCNVLYVDCPDKTQAATAVCGPGPCDNFSCPANQSCYLKSSCTTSPAQDAQPYCSNPCLKTQCAKDEACYVVQVQCVKAPCYAVAECKNPCNVTRCSSNEECELEYVQCFTEPCYPIPKCVPKNCPKS